MDVCRVCLCTTPEKNIYELKTSKKDGSKDYSEIFQFCLDISIKETTEVCKRLCSKCSNKLLIFFKFKTMALKNDVYLKSLLGSESCIKPEIIQEDKPASCIEDNCSQIDLNPEPEIHSLKIEVGSEQIFVEVKQEEIVDEDSLQTESAEKVISTSVQETKRSLRRRSPPHKKERKPKKTKLKTSQRKGAVPGICDQCGSSVSNLKEHALKHVPLHDRRKYPCQSCDKVYIEPSALRKHFKTKHLGILSHCDICNKDVSNLSAHQRVWHRRDSLPMQCSVCQLRCVSKSALERHQTKHTDEKAFQCDHCGNKFKLKMTLDSHVRTVHLKQKNVVCAVCMKGFFGKGYLEKHMSTLYMHLRAHRKLKPYCCRHCGVGYARNFDRKKHERKHHPGHDKH